MFNFVNAMQMNSLKSKLAGAAVAMVALCCGGEAEAQFRYGPSVGVDVTDLRFNQDLFTVDQGVGYQAGIMGEMMFPGIGFGIDIGLQYTQRGATLNLGERPLWSSLGYGRERAYLHYVDIPVDLRFKWTRMNGFESYLAPFVFGGPVFSFMAAHNDIEALEYPFCSLGLQCGVGFEICRRWQIQGAYQWGMTYAVRTKLLDDFSGRNSTWSVKVNYLF